MMKNPILHFSPAWPLSNCTGKSIQMARQIIKPRKMPRIRKAAILLVFLSLAVAIMSADGFGHCASMTSFEGRVVDADTLEPIEGALVVAIWMEWKGGGMLSKQRFRDARESLTDDEGKWSFQGLAGGTSPDSSGQILLSFLTGYRHEPPQFFIYKKGYAGFPSFFARPYRNAKTDLYGIVLFNIGNTKEEREAYLEMNPSTLSVFLVPIDEPEKKLRSLDFNFSYGPDVRRIPRSEYSKDGYVVYGLNKTADIREMRNGRPSLPAGACNKLPIACKYNRGLRPSVNSLPVELNSGGNIETEAGAPGSGREK